MGAMSRRKGAVGERELAAALTDAGFPAHRGVQYQGGHDSPDVECPALPGIHWEVKRTERLCLYNALRQATSDARGRVPVVAHRSNGAPWVAILALSDLLAILRDAGRSAPEGAVDTGAAGVMLAEIDENLCRSNLTPTQEAEHIAKRKEIWEAMEQARQVVAPVAVAKHGHAQDDGFATATEKATGVSARTTQRAVRRATEVCQEARDLIRGTKLDTGTFLDRLAKGGLSPREQVDRAREALEALADMGVTKAQSSRWQKLAADARSATNPRNRMNLQASSEQPRQVTYVTPYAARRNSPRDGHPLSSRAPAARAEAGTITKEMDMGDKAQTQPPDAALCCIRATPNPDAIFARPELTGAALTAAVITTARFDGSFPGWQLYRRIITGFDGFDAELLDWATGCAWALARAKTRRGREYLRAGNRGPWIDHAAADALYCVIYGKWPVNAAVHDRIRGVVGSTYRKIRNPVMSGMSVGLETFRSELHYHYFRVRKLGMRENSGSVVMDGARFPRAVHAGVRKAGMRENTPYYGMNEF